MAGNAPAPRLQGDPFLAGEPSSHPDVNPAPAASAASTAAPAPAPAVAAAAASPSSVPDVFTMGDPTGQGGGGPPTKPVPYGTGEPGSMTVQPDLTKQDTTGLLDPMNPPVELFGSPTLGQFVKTGMATAGSVLGGIAGVPAGGGVADIATVPAGAYLGGVLGGQVYNSIQNLTEALTGQTNAQGEPITLAQETIDALMNGTISLAGGWGQAIGAETSAAVNSVLKPLLRSAGKAAPYVEQGVGAAGRIAGGGAGVASGTLAAEGAVGATAGVAKVWGLLPPDARTPDMLQALKDAWANGGLDVVVNGALHVPMGVKPLVRAGAFKLFGITPEMITNAEMAHRFGIPLGMNNVADKSTLATVIRTVTSVIPLVGHPYRDLENKQITAINKYSQDLPQRVAEPSTTGLPTVAQAGTDARARANEAFKAVAQTYNDKFDLLVARAKSNNIGFSIDSKAGIDANGSSVPSLRNWAGSILARTKARYTTQYNMEPGAKPGSAAPIPLGKTNVAVDNPDLIKLADKITTAMPNQTVDQLNALGAEADAIYQKYVENGDKSDASIARLGDQINAFKDSLHGAFTDSFETIESSKGSYPAVGHEILKLDKQYADSRKMFQNATGATLSKSSIALPADVLGDTLFSNMDSPHQVDELRRIVGDKVMNDGAATFMQDIVSTATKDAGTPKQAFNVEDFAKAIGVDNPSSNRYQAVSRALQTSGVTMRELTDFVKAARLSGQNQPPGLATMLVRKMTFGGFGSIIKTLVPLAAAEAGHSVFGPHVGAIGTAGGILISWKAADIMTNPAYLRDATTFMNPAAGEAERRMAMWRVAKAVLPADQWQGQTDDKNAGTGKTPPKTIMQRVDRAAGEATDTYFQGSTFLNNILTNPGGPPQ